MSTVNKEETRLIIADSLDELYSEMGVDRGLIISFIEVLDKFKEKDHEDYRRKPNYR